MWVKVGRVGRTHGLRGELTLDQCSLTPEELTAVGRFTWRGKNGAARELVLEAARPAIPRVLVAFQGVASREAAQELVNGELMAEADRLPDPGPGVAYTFQLIGLKVRTEDGRELGVLESVIPTGAHGIYEVKGERELLIPSNPEVVKSVDLEAGVITVRLPAGLEDL